MDENKNLRTAFQPYVTLLEVILPRTKFPAENFEHLLLEEVVFEDVKPVEEKETSILEQSQSSSGRGRPAKGKRGRKPKANKSVSPPSANSSISKQPRTWTKQHKAVKNNDVLPNELNLDAWYST
jgi:hypothetical protein